MCSRQSHFLKKIRNEGRALCLQEMQAHGGYFCRDFLHNEKDKTRIFAKGFFFFLHGGGMMVLYKRDKGQKM